MKIQEYHELSPSDKLDYHDLMRDNLKFSPTEWKDHITLSFIDPDTYFNQRLEERKKITTVQWPEKLSKKESIICRLRMMEKMLNEAIPLDEDADAMRISARMFVLTLMKEIFAFKNDINNKWPGLDKDVAELLNIIYSNTLPWYERKLKI